MVKWLLIFLGAGFGGVARYGLDGIVQWAFGPTFPVGTLIINVTGCLAMGFLAVAMTDVWLVRESYRVGVLVGVLGGYTTFSTFGRDTMRLVDDAEWGRAGAYVFLSVALSLLAVWAGAAVAHKFYGGAA